MFFSFANALRKEIESYENRHLVGMVHLHSIYMRKTRRDVTRGHEANYFLHVGLRLIVPVFEPLEFSLLADDESVLEVFSLFGIAVVVGIGMPDLASNVSGAFVILPGVASTLCTISVFSAYDGFSIPSSSFLRENDGILVTLGFSLRDGFSLCSSALSRSLFWQFCCSGDGMADTFGIFL